jgi:hypothetical protein
MLVTQSQKKFIIGFKTLGCSPKFAFSGFFFQVASVFIDELGDKAFNRVEVPERRTKKNT